MTQNINYAVRYARPVNDVISERYGEKLTHKAISNPIIKHILMHRSVREFTGDPVSDVDVEQAIAAAQSAATSSHLQSWSVIKIADKLHKREINRLCGSQGQIEAAPLMLIWLADQSRNFAIAQLERTRTEGFDYFESIMLGIVDVCMAAQNAALAFEALGYGTCFIGAVRNNASTLADILDLPERCIPVVGLVVGRPHPIHETDIKPRLGQQLVVCNETYDHKRLAGISAYNQIMNQFQHKQWMPSVNWTTKVAQRLSSKGSLHGRDRYMDYLKAAKVGVE